MIRTATPAKPLRIPQITTKALEEQPTAKEVPKTLNFFQETQAKVSSANMLCQLKYSTKTENAV
jgi:hypothetical protein